MNDSRPLPDLIYRAVDALPARLSAGMDGAFEAGVCELLERVADEMLDPGTHERWYRDANGTPHLWVFSGPRLIDSRQTWTAAVALARSILGEAPPARPEMG